METYYRHIVSLMYDHKMNPEYIENLYVFEYEYIIMILHQRLTEDRMNAEMQKMQTQASFINEY